MTRPDAQLSVAHVLWSGGVGGIERLVSDLAAQQIRHGLDVTVIFGQARGPFLQDVRSSGARVVGLGLTRGFGWHRGRIQHAVRLFRQSDVVHLHAYNFVLAAAVRRSGRPVLFTEHGNFGHAHHPTPANRWKAWRKERFLKRLPLIVANSKFTAVRARGLYHLGSIPVRVVHNGVACSDATRSASLSVPSGLQLAVIGRLVDWKRPELALEALARCRITDLRLDFVGRGPLEDALRARAEELGLRQRVTFRGHEEDVIGYLGTVDVLLHPAQGEPFGLAIAEAVACGVLPVVLADGGGALEVIPPDGVIVRDAEQMASALESVVGSAALSPSARRKRAAWASSRLPISRTADSYLDLYRAVEAQGSAPRVLGGSLCAD